MKTLSQLYTEYGTCSLFRFLNDNDYESIYRIVKREPNKTHELFIVIDTHTCTTHTVSGNRWVNLEKSVTVQVGKWYRTYNGKRVRCKAASLSIWNGKERDVYHFYLSGSVMVYTILDDKGRDSAGIQIITGEA